MYAATLLGFMLGEVADRHAPVSGIWFLILAVTSILCLGLATFCGHGHDRPGRLGALPCVGLAMVAASLVASDAYRQVGQESIVPQVLTTLPFLMGVGHFARHGTWLSAIGSTGFLITTVGMLHANSHGGWVGFFGVYCR